MNGILMKSALIAVPSYYQELSNNLLNQFQLGGATKGYAYDLDLGL